MRKSMAGETSNSAARSLSKAPVRGLRRMRFVIVAVSAVLLVAHSALEYVRVLNEKDHVVSGVIEDAETLLTTLDEHLSRTIHAGAPLLALAASEVETRLRWDTFDRISLYDTFNRVHRGAP